EARQHPALSLARACLHDGGWPMLLSRRHWRSSRLTAAQRQIGSERGSIRPVVINEQEPIAFGAQMLQDGSDRLLVGGRANPAELHAERTKISARSMASVCDRTHRADHDAPGLRPAQVRGCQQRASTGAEARYSRRGPAAGPPVTVNRSSLLLPFSFSIHT